MTVTNPPIWMPTPVWAGQTAFCVGGGDSLRGFDGERLRGRNVIACNSSGLLVPNMGAVLAFMDEAWAKDRLDFVQNWCGIVATIHTVNIPALRDRVKYRPYLGEGHTGQFAIRLAQELGATRIILLGYDMKMSPDGRTHWHDEYTTKHAAGYGDGFIRCMDFMNEITRKAGCTVLNATPDSALTEFDFVDIDDVLPKTPDCAMHPSWTDPTMKSY